MRFGGIDFTEDKGLLVPSDPNFKVPSPNWLNWAGLSIHSLVDRALLAPVDPSEEWRKGPAVSVGVPKWHGDEKLLVALVNLHEGNQRRTQWISLEDAFKKVKACPAAWNSLPARWKTFETIGHLQGYQREDLRDDLSPLLNAGLFDLNENDGRVDVDWSSHPNSVFVFNDAQGLHRPFYQGQEHWASTTRSLHRFVVFDNQGASRSAMGGR